MRKFYISLLLIIVVGSVYAQDIENYKVKVGQFDKLKVLDNVNVVYRCLPDSSGFIQYSGRKEFADAFIITPKQDGTLKIQVSTEDVGNPDLPVLYVYSDYLTAVENSSVFSLFVESPAPCAAFKATQIGNGSITVENVKTNKLTAAIKTGNGTVNISGSCQTAVLQMLGTGIISADRLKTETVECKILGSGSIGCWAVGNLSVKGIGSTKIYYKGEPHVKKSGGGKLFPLPDGRPVDVVIDEREEDGATLTDDATTEETGMADDYNDDSQANPADDEVALDEDDSTGEDDEEEMTVVVEGEDDDTPWTN